MSLERFIKFIKEGEPVSPGTPNRPLRQLDQNIQYLWDVIDASNMGSTVYAREVRVESTVEVGMPSCSMYPVTALLWSCSARAYASKLE